MSLYGKVSLYGKISSIQQKSNQRHILTLFFNRTARFSLYIKKCGIIANVYILYVTVLSYNLTDRVMVSSMVTLHYFKLMVRKYIARWGIDPLTSSMHRFARFTTWLQRNEVICIWRAIFMFISQFPTIFPILPFHNQVYRRSVD